MNIRESKNNKRHAKRQGNAHSSNLTKKRKTYLLEYSNILQIPIEKNSNLYKALIIQANSKLLKCDKRFFRGKDGIILENFKTWQSKNKRGTLIPEFEDLNQIIGFPNLAEKINFNQSQENILDQILETISSKPCNANEFNVDTLEPPKLEYSGTLGGNINKNSDLYKFLMAISYERRLGIEEKETLLKIENLDYSTIENWIDAKNTKQLKYTLLDGVNISQIILNNLLAFHQEMINAAIQSELTQHETGLREIEDSEKIDIVQTYSNCLGYKEILLFLREKDVTIAQINHWKAQIRSGDIKPRMEFYSSNINLHGLDLVDIDHHQPRPSTLAQLEEKQQVSISTLSSSFESTNPNRLFSTPSYQPCSPVKLDESEFKFVELTEADIINYINNIP